MTSQDTGHPYTLRSRKQKMVPYVSSSSKQPLIQDPQDSLSNHEPGTSRIMSDNQDGLAGVTVLGDSLVNGTATVIPLQDPGGVGTDREGKATLKILFTVLLCTFLLGSGC